MERPPLRTSVIGSYPFPGWLEFAAGHLAAFGSADVAEMQDDAVVAALHDQLAAGLDVVTDGEQTRFDFNLSFYGYLEGIELEAASPRRFGPPAHDQRGKHRITSELRAPRGLGAVEEYERLRRLAADLGTGGAAGDGTVGRAGPTLKVSVPGPYTLAGRLLPNEQYADRYAITEALIPIVRDELVRLVEAGCGELTVDEPSMSCYGHREDPRRFVEIFNRTVEPVRERARISTHLCFGNFKGRAVGRRQYGPLFPAFLGLAVDELHVEMASREFAEIELIGQIAERCDVAVGVVDVKSYYIESPEDVAERVRLCLQHCPAERLVLAPDCGLSQTARWAARKKLAHMVEGVQTVRKELGA